MFVTLLYMHGVKDAGYQTIVNLLYQCDAASAGYCELAVPVCDGSAGGTRSGPGGEGLRRLLHGGCCQPAGGCPQAPPAPSSAGIFLFTLDCSSLFFLCSSSALPATAAAIKTKQIAQKYNDVTRPTKQMLLLPDDSVMSS